MLALGTSMYTRHPTNLWGFLGSPVARKGPVKNKISYKMMNYLDGLTYHLMPDLVK